jgi:hypothetical protein
MQLQPDWSRPLPQRIVIPTVATLTTLADARVLIQQKVTRQRSSLAMSAVIPARRRNGPGSPFR